MELDVAVCFCALRYSHEAPCTLWCRRIPDMGKVLEALAAREYLPAIWFILSRRDCDISAIKAAG